MRLTSKGRYAVRAMLDLTANSNGNPVRLQEISQRQAISLHYLEQLFRKLRTGKVVKSVRGPGGGYVLSRSMDEITVKDILECVGENINPAKDIVGLPSSGVEVKTSGSADQAHLVDTPEFRLTRQYFINLGSIMTEYLTTTSLGDLRRQANDIGGSSLTAVIKESGSSANANTNNAFGATNTNNDSNAANTAASIIRPNIGEINQ